MKTLEKILVIIEPEQDKQLALEKAVRLARLAGASLELLICDHNPYLEDGYYFDPLQAAELRRDHIDKNRQLLEDMAVVMRGQGLTVSVDALWGNPPYRQIIKKVLHSKPDLLVQASRHHEKISRLLLSHQDWQLLRYCPCPVLLVKDQPWPEHPPVMVAVDPIHANDKPASLDNELTGAGVLLANLFDSKVHVFHSCYQPPVSGLYPVTVNVDTYKEKTAGLLKAFNLGDDQLHISDVEVKKSLPATLQSVGASVLVMGAVSRSAIDRFLIGSTAERILDKVSQDVLVLKPEGFTDTVKTAMPESP